MNDADVLTLIKEALFEVAPDATFEHVSLHTSVAELGLDSITINEMIGFLEDRVDLEFPEAELARLKSIGDLAALVRGQRVGA